jgi:hypothetical protein
MTDRVAARVRQIGSVRENGRIQEVHACICATTYRTKIAGYAERAGASPIADAPLALRLMRGLVRSMENAERWIKHNLMSDPAGHIDLVAELPSDISALDRTVQGLLVYSDWLAAYGLDNADYRTVSRNTLPVAGCRSTRRYPRKRPARFASRAATRQARGRDLSKFRAHAVRLSAQQRRRRQVRCGFADYLGTAWEDHWVCEYWEGHAQQWRLSDAQLDSLIAAKCQIDFDPADEPRHVFMTAGEAWLACRDGKLDPRHFGHGNVTGSWFIKINVIRDHSARCRTSSRRER